jgi:starch synthase
VRVRGEATTAWVKVEGRLTTVLVEHERFFGSRRGLYTEHGHEYGDNAERFAWFCRAALAVPAAFGHRPSVVHLNDWHTGLAAWLLRREHAEDAALRGARTVFTIHNLAYQGSFDKELMPALGLPWELFRADAIEFHDRINFMKAGLVFSDAITTVSPTYAHEITTPEGGEGLDGLLRARRGALTGILNGLDAEAWDPARDPHLPAHFDAGRLGGKQACRRALQEELGLPQRTDVPVVGLVGRLAEQKGVDLVLAALPELLRRNLQLVLLGSGRRDWEAAFAEAARHHPGRLAVRIGFDEGLAHRIEAGSDIFLMPSRFEPCGLNQLYSLRYGTVPVVRRVGGLADTVEDFDGWKRGTGFVFDAYDAGAMLVALRRAKELFRDKRAWHAMMRRGMGIDFSWARSAERYRALYRGLVG